MYIGDSTYELKHADYTHGKMLGKVFKTQDEVAAGSYVAFYVPKLLPLMESTQGPIESDEPVLKSIFANNGDTMPSIPSTVSIVNYIKCKYNAYSNFAQSIIALGETAWIFFFDGDYKYPRYLDENPEERKRKTDTVELFVYGKPDVDDIPPDYYKLRISTRENLINIHTSKENGEDHVYDFIIDTKNNFVEIKDEKNNHMLLETDKKRLLSENETGSFTEIIDRDINHYCPGNYSIECDNYSLDAKTTIKRKAGVKIDDTAPVININGNSIVKITTPMLNLSVSSLLKSSAPMNKFDVAIDVNSILIHAAFTSQSGISYMQGLTMSKMYLIG